MSVRPKSVCDSCSATYIIVHELPEDMYTEQYCPFCGEEHEDIEEGGEFFVGSRDGVVRTEGVDLGVSRGELLEGGEGALL